MLWHREFGFYYKPNYLSLTEYTLFTGELGIKWNCIYTNIKDVKLGCKYSTKLSQNWFSRGKNALFALSLSHEILLTCAPGFSCWSTPPPFRTPA